MPKDSKDSCAQRFWEIAVRSHTQYTEMLKSVRPNSFMECKLNELITELEKHHPQLKQK